MSPSHCSSKGQDVISKWSFIEVQTLAYWQSLFPMDGEVRIPESNYPGTSQLRALGELFRLHVFLFTYLQKPIHRCGESIQGGILEKRFAGMLSYWAHTVNRSIILKVSGKTLLWIAFCVESFPTSRHCCKIFVCTVKMCLCLRALLIG